jgi:hypothetical protein
MALDQVAGEAPLFIERLPDAPPGSAAGGFPEQMPDDILWEVPIASAT